MTLKVRDLSVSFGPGRITFQISDTELPPFCHLIFTPESTGGCGILGVLISFFGLLGKNLIKSAFALSILAFARTACDTGTINCFSVSVLVFVPIVSFGVSVTVCVVVHGVTLRFVPDNLPDPVFI